MLSNYKVAFRADNRPYIVRELEIPETWKGDLINAVRFLKPQWELGVALAAELQEAKSEFSIGHSGDIIPFASNFRSPNHERWQHLRHGLPSNLLSNDFYVVMEPFWQYVFEALFAQTYGLACMLENKLIDIQVPDTLPGNYVELFGGTPESHKLIPGLIFSWAHPSKSFPFARVSFSELELHRDKPEIIDGWRA